MGGGRDDGSKWMRKAVGRMAVGSGEGAGDAECAAGIYAMANHDGPRRQRKKRHTQRRDGEISSTDRGGDVGLVRRGPAVKGGGSGETVPPQFFSFNSTTAAITLIFIPQRQNNRDCTAHGLPFFYLSLFLRAYMHEWNKAGSSALRPLTSALDISTWTVGRTTGGEGRNETERQRTT